MQSPMRPARFRRLLTGCIGVAACGPLLATAGGEIPLRFNAPTGIHAKDEVLYDSVSDSLGNRMHVIVTRPQRRSGAYPVVFQAGWLRCDSIKVPSRADDASAKVFRVMAVLPGIVTVRMDLLFNENYRVLVHQGIWGLPRLLAD
jgi:hypothetical protein